jgi:hypothetical protein
VTGLLYFWIGVCIASVLAALMMLRREKLSLGLPVAYLFALLLIHLPGAWLYALGRGREYPSVIELGIRLTAIGAVSFVVGVWLVRLGRRPQPAKRVPYNHKFWVFCLVGGWTLVYGVSILLSLPTVGAVVEKGGAVWMLGVMLGLAHALRRGDLRAAALWGSAMFVYPILMLMLGGFMSYGSTAVIIVCSLLAVSTRKVWKVIFSIVLASYLALTVFANYFAIRDTLRLAVWGGAPISQRIDIATDAMANATLLDVDNRNHAKALDERLNQNYFVGLAAERLANKQVDFLYGRSVWEGVLALVPRALWPNKPVYAGSGTMVTDMTGLRLNIDTSWGVGNVMEFYINFRMVGLIGGFLLLGGLIGWCDLKAASALRSGKLGDSIIYFLPAVAMIQPNGSVIEITGGAGAALAAAFAWRAGWRAWLRFRQYRFAPQRHPALSRP